MSDSSQSTRAFLLRSVDYGESDRIVTLLTENIGKIAAIARGAKRSSKRFGGVIEPFALIEITVGSRGKGLWTMSEASLVAAHAELARDLARLGAASLVLELVREVTAEHVPDRKLFALVEGAMRSLCGVEPRLVESIALAAVLQVLASAGVAMSVDRCNACGKPVPPKRKVLLNPARGGVVCTPCGGGPSTLGSVDAEALVFLGRLDIVRSVEFSGAPEVSDAMKAAVLAFLDHQVSRPLRSASLLNAPKV